MRLSTADARWQEGQVRYTDDMPLREVKLAENGKVAGTLTISRFRNGALISKSEPIPNKVVSSSGGYGRNLITRQLAGDAALPLAIDSAALGDDDTAPVDADTDLGNATVTDIPLTNSTASDDELHVDVFVADANLQAATYKEFGLYCAGRLFARILISPAHTKADGEDTLFSYDLTLSG